MSTDTHPAGGATGADRELSERYVRATVRHVPKSSREDVARELRASIADMADARVDAGQSPAEAEYAVLEELGEPERLAATYAGRDLVLIGPRLYLHWRKLVELLLWIVVPIVTVVVLVVGVAAEDPFNEIFGAVFGAAWNTAINIAFWVTLVFAVIERYAGETAADEVDDADRWTPDKLPELSAGSGGISLGETVSTVAFLTVVIAFFPWQEWRPIEFGGIQSPLLNSDLWTTWIPFLIAVLVVEIIYEVVKYRIGRRTTGLLLTHLAINLAFAIPVVWLLLTGDMLHPDLAQTFSTTQDRIDLTANIAAAVVIAISVWDVLDAAWNTYGQSARADTTA